MPVKFDSPAPSTGRIVFDDEPSSRIVFDEPSPYAAIIKEAQDFQKRAAENTPERAFFNLEREAADEAYKQSVYPIGVWGTQVDVPKVIPEVIGPLAARVAPPIATAIGLGSGVGTLPTIGALLLAGGAGEFAGQTLEKGIGQRDQYSLAEGALNTALTPVTVGPLKGVSAPLVRMGIRGLEGAGLAAGQDIGMRAIRGEEQNLGETLRNAGIGGVIGGTLGLGEFGRGRSLGVASQGGVPSELSVVGQAMREPIIPQVVEPALPQATDVVPAELSVVRQAQAISRAEQTASRTQGERAVASLDEAVDSEKVRKLAERMMGKTPDQQLAVLDQEMRLQKDYLTPAEQRAGLDMKQELQRQIDSQKAMEEAASLQQKAAADQQKAMADAQKAAAIPPPEPAPPPFQQKPRSMANEAAELAGTSKKNDNVTLQASLNQISGVKPVPPQPISAPALAADAVNPVAAAIPEPVADGRPPVTTDPAKIAADRVEYDALQAQMKKLGYDKVGTDEFNAIWQKSEDVKNRHGGMPPVVKTEPVVTRAFHGGKTKITKFDEGKIGSDRGDGWLGEGFYFSPDESAAKAYGDEVTIVDVTLSNPFRFPDGVNPIKFVEEKGGSKAFTKWAKEQGHDGVISDRILNQVVAFDGEQVKTIRSSAPAPEPGRRATPARAAPQSEAAFLRGSVPESAPVAGRDAEATRAASIRRQQRGAVPVSALAPIGGAGAGGVTGFATTEREPGESDEAFQARRLRNATVGASLGAGGAVLAKSAAKAFSSKESTKLKTLNAIQQEAIGRERMPDWYIKWRQSPQMTKIREGVNNSRTRVKDLVANVSKDINLPDTQNPYLAGKLFPGRASERVRQAEDTMRKVQDTVVEAAKASGVKVDDFVKRFDLWLEARHTPYYNAALRERHEGPGPYPQHRFTDEQAAEILQETGADGFAKVFDDLSREYTNVLDGTRDLLVKGGIIDQNTADLWKKQYPFYAPFNRILPEDSLEGAVDKFVGGGPGLNVLGTGVYRIKGSDLPVADIGGSIYANFLDAIRRTEKNRVDQSALEFFMGPGKGTPGINVRSPKFGERFDANTMLAVRKQGDPYIIEFSDPKLATAFSNLNAENATGLLKLISYPTRWFSGLVTRFNPNFLAANPIRDRQEAALKLASQGDWGGAVQMMNPKKALYSDPKTVVDWVRGANSPEAGLFQQMLDDGGMAGGFASSTRKKAEDAVKEFRVSDVNPIVGAKDKFVKFVDFLTDISEGSTRFRAYKRALDSGATRDQAALAARNVSVDFNQKGTLTPQAAALWSFFNPAVQGPINSTKALMRNPETIATVAAAFVGTGALIDAWNSSYDPDWKKKPSFQFSRTSGMPVIYGKDEQTGELLTFNFPVAHALRPVKATMDFFMDGASGDIDVDNLPEEMARVGGAVLDSTNPLGSGSIKTALAPTVARPVLDVLINEKFTGSPIVPKFMESDSLMEDRAKRYLSSYDTNTGKMANNMADTLYSSFGIDVSPERMKYLIRQYSGGPGRVVSDAINTAPKALSALSDTGKPKGFRASETPVASAFFRRVNPEVSERESPAYKETEKYVKRAKSDEELTRQQARLFYRDYVEKVPVENRVAFLNELAVNGRLPSDPVFGATLLNQLRDGMKGRDQTDNLVSALGVDSGARAMYYNEQTQGMSPEEKNSFLTGQAQRGLLNETVFQQMQSLAGSPDQSRVANMSKQERAFYFDDYLKRLRPEEVGPYIQDARQKGLMDPEIEAMMLQIK